MKKRISCCFVDFWWGFDYRYHFSFLLKEYSLVINTEKPDYVFYSCFGYEHLSYENCIKIFWSVENILPDLNVCDYAISLGHVQCDDRTYRLKFVIYEKEYIPVLKTKEELLQRKFCNFVYSNNLFAHPYRELIFNELSKYKRIDAGGAFLNNIGRRVENKLQFLSEYKFTLAIENSSSSGYITEKILHPFLVQSVPLYWGCPNINLDYNPDSFVNLMNFSSMEEAIEEIIRLDKDDEAYLEKVMAPCWLYGDSFEENKEYEINRLLDFLRHIFDQPLQDARRRALYGRNMDYCLSMKKAFDPTIHHLSKMIIKKLVEKIKK